MTLGGAVGGRDCKANDAQAPDGDDGEDDEEGALMAGQDSR